MIRDSEDKEILAIIPARGGSKGIPRKNISLLNGKPLIAHSIKAVLNSGYFDDVFVSTDDDEIAEIATLYGAKVVERPGDLAGDKIPLDPVIFHAVNHLEKEKKIRYDYICTIQPTCPLLSTDSLNKAIETMYAGDYDTLISVVDETHLYWRKKDSENVPLYVSRKNRQYLDSIYKETGSIVISKREVVNADSRFGKDIFLFELPKNESVDIDNYEDWWIAENLLKKKKIVFRVDGDKKIGLGHVYRTITLAKRMAFNHDVCFVMDEKKKMGVEKVLEYHFDIRLFSDKKNLMEVISDLNPDIVVNDILDTDKEYVKFLKENGYSVINFEDMGEGVEYADVVINALYENSYPPENHFYGYKYICLRDEFYIFPKKTVKEDVDRILITFGGTDPNNLTMKTLKAVEELDIKDINFNVILGLGCSDKESINEYISHLIKKGFSVSLKENVSMMAKEMYDADIVITSNGRTVYEVASVGTPCISIAQNEREVMHLFVHNSKAINYLGMAHTLKMNKLKKELLDLINDYDHRKEMSKKLLSFDLQAGINRVCDLILNDYKS
jgi:CMP-N-acetylneuraminic acid synthetase/spore coat polysaccharide biosynthesis predicted glycosyltransferase SpsG